MASGNQAAAPAPHPEATQAAALESALKQNKPAALEAYLLKNPAEPRRAELWEKVSALRRAEYTEWTIFDIAVKLQVPAYFQFSSIRPVGGNRYAMLSRIPLDRSLPTYIKDLPDGAYQQSLDVYDCQVAKSWEAEVTYYSQSGDELYHYKWADPEFIADIVQPTQIASGSLAASARRVVCNSRLRTPAVDKEQVAKTAFASLATAPSGDGELYYQLAAENASSVDVYASMIARYSAAKKMADVFGVAYGGLRYRATVQLVEIKCTENKIFLAKTEYYSDSTELIDIAAGDPGLATNWATIAERSPFDLLHRIVCPPTGK